MAFEIEMLSIGAADAIIVRYINTHNQEVVILIDAGNKGDGKKIVDFIIENSAKKIEEVIDLTNLNFDVDLNKNKAIQILMSEIITIQKDIKEINVMKKNTTGLKING